VDEQVQSREGVEDLQRDREPAIEPPRVRPDIELPVQRFGPRAGAAIPCGDLAELRAQGNPECVRIR